MSINFKDEKFEKAIKKHCVDVDMRLRSFLRMCIEKELKDAKSPYLKEFEPEFVEVDDILED